MKNKNKFLVLIGKSASGKTSIAELLCNKYGYKQYKTVTTRPKRKDEDDNAYYFWSKKKFENEIKKDNFIEVKICVNYAIKQKDSIQHMCFVLIVVKTIIRMDLNQVI